MATGPSRGATAPDPVAHYDEAYFEYQRTIGEFSGWAELTKFTKYVTPADRVVDFGCGAAYILKNLSCAERIGVEVSSRARTAAEAENGIVTVPRVSDLPDAAADVIISNHALEHCACPFAELVALRQKLKPGGLFVCYVPHEAIGNRWSPGSIDNHLYTWNPMTLGNLFSSAGYEVVTVGGFYHLWPPFYYAVAKLGRRFFDACSFAYGTLKRHNSQVKIVARRPAS